MKKIILLLILPFSLFSQNIKFIGKVTNFETKEYIDDVKMTIVALDSLKDTLYVFESLLRYCQFNKKIDAGTTYLISFEKEGFYKKTVYIDAIFCPYRYKYKIEYEVFLLPDSMKEEKESLFFFYTPKEDNFIYKIKKTK